MIVINTKVLLHPSMSQLSCHLKGDYRAQPCVGHSSSALAKGSQNGIDTKPHPNLFKKCLFHRFFQLKVLCTFIVRIFLLSSTLLPDLQGGRSPACPCDFGIGGWCRRVPCSNISCCFFSCQPDVTKYLQRRSSAKYSWVSWIYFSRHRWKRRPRAMLDMVIHVICIGVIWVI